MVGLLAETHNRVMCMLSEKMGGGHNGLTIIARAARVQKLIDNRMAKKIERLDVAFAVVRHASPQKLIAFMEELQIMLKSDEMAYLYQQPKKSRHDKEVPVQHEDSAVGDDDLLARVVKLDAFPKNEAYSAGRGRSLERVSIRIPQKRSAAAGIVSGKVKQRGCWKPKTSSPTSTSTPATAAVGDSSRCAWSEGGLDHAPATSVPGPTAVGDSSCCVRLGDGLNPAYAKQNDDEGGEKEMNMEVDHEMPAEIDVEKKAVKGADGYLNLEIAGEMRLQGNEFFKAGQVKDALEMYTTVLERISPTEMKERATLFCNRAACLQKLFRWEQVIADCSCAIEIDPTYAKAFFRRSVALEAVGRWAHSLADLENAIRLEPSLYQAHQERRARLVERARESSDEGEDCAFESIAGDDWKDLTEAEERELMNAANFWEWYADSPVALLGQHDIAMPG